jgi:hypothetical protein
MYTDAINTARNISARTGNDCPERKYVYLTRCIDPRRIRGDMDSVGNCVNGLFDRFNLLHNRFA